MRGRLDARAAALALLLALGAGCRGPLIEEAAGFRHREQAWSIGRPEVAGAPWTRVELDGALLAFERRDHELLSLQSHCGRPIASAELLARHLLIGLRGREVVAAGPVEVDGRSAWRQSVTLTANGLPARLETVTVVAGSCTLDWILAQRGSDPDAIASFDAWWASFRGPPERREEPAS